MAMIVCPQCGKEISDKASKCVQCGFELKTPEKIFCAECGAELETDETVCHNCGAPVENESEKIAPQQVEVTGIKIKKKINKKQKSLIALLIIVAVIVIAVMCWSKYYQRIKAEQAAEAARIVYSENLELTTYSMLSGAAKAEECGNLIKQVWYNSIYEERDDTTDKYTRPNGYFVSDFNDALSNLFTDSSFTSDIEDIDSNMETVQDLMKELQNPPEEYEEAYEAISELYTAYTELLNYATNPSGSLSSYSTGFNEADSNMMNCYNAMDLYLDD